MRRIRRLLSVAILILVIIGAAAWYFLARGFSARNPPNAIEAFVPPRLRPLAVPRNALDAKNPVVSSPEVLSEAMAHFADHCAICHGTDGGGHTHIADGLYPKPPDMREPATQDLSDGEIFYIIRNGVRFTGMPAFGEDTEDDDLDSWKLVTFIRHLRSMTPEELAKMEELIPKSPMEMQQDEEIQKFLKGEDTAPPPQGHVHH